MKISLTFHVALVTLFPCIFESWMWWISCLFWDYPQSYLLWKILINRILPRGIWEIYNIFNFKEVTKLASFRVKLVNFLSEKGRSSFLLRSLHFGSNRLMNGFRCVHTTWTLVEQEFPDSMNASSNWLN